MSIILVTYLEFWKGYHAVSGRLSVKCVNFENIESTTNNQNGVVFVTCMINQAHIGTIRSLYYDQFEFQSCSGFVEKS